MEPYMNELFQELQNTHAKLEVRHCYVSFTLVSTLPVNDWYILHICVPWDILFYNLVIITLHSLLLSKVLAG